MRKLRTRTGNTPRCSEQAGLIESSVALLEILTGQCGEGHFPYQSGAVRDNNSFRRGSHRQL